jgi:Zn-dependent alcohol dehydrogenase
LRLPKIRKDVPFEKVCYIGCGVTTGTGAVINSAKVEPRSDCFVFGFGGIGLNIIQGLHLVGANMIVGVDLNPDKKMGRALRHCLTSSTPRRPTATSSNISSTSPWAAPTTASNASAMST